MRTSFLLLGSLALVGCGGKVVVDGPGDPGAGGGTSSSTSSASTSSSSASSASSSTGASCPEFPLIPAPCSIPGQVCPLPFGCCNGNAVCGEGHTWGYLSLGCAEACIDCGGGLSCIGGAICVDYQPGFSQYFSCRKDPCPGSTDCGCIESMCDEASLSCQSHQATKLVCDCPTC